MLPAAFEVGQKHTSFDTRPCWLVAVVVATGSGNAYSGGAGGVGRGRSGTGVEGKVDFGTDLDQGSHLDGMICADDRLDCIDDFEDDAFDLLRHYRHHRRN